MAGAQPDPGPASNSDNARNVIWRSLVSTNLDITRSIYMHPKILGAALNGPSVGLSAALLGSGQAEIL